MNATEFDIMNIRITVTYGMRAAAHKYALINRPDSYVPHGASTHPVERRSAPGDNALGEDA